MDPSALNSLMLGQSAMDWHERQKQAESGGIMDTLGKVALGAGLAGAALYGAKRLGGTVDLSGVDLGKLRRKVSGFVAPKGETPGTPPPSRPAPTTSVERLQNIEEVTRAARAERPQGVSLVDTERRRMYAKIEEPPVGWEQGARPIREIAPTSSAASRKEVYEAIADKPDEAVPYVSIPGMERDVRVTLTDPRTGEIFKSGKSPESFKETYVKLHGTPGTFAEFSQKASVLQKEVNTAQAAAQSDFGPQQYFKSQQYVEADNLVDQHQVKALGRIDQTVNAIDTAEDQMTGRVRQQLQRNEDVNLNAVDQLEDVTGSIDIAASQFEDGLPTDQAEGITRPITAQEQADLAKQEMIVRRQELEARGFRPGTVRFERALAEPFRTSASTQMRGTGAVETALPAGPIRGTVEAVSASEYLPEKIVLNVGPQAEVTSTAAGTSIRGAAPSYQTVPSKEETRQLFGTPEPLVPGAPNEMGPDFPGSARVRGVMPELEAGEQLSKQEIVYGALDRPVAPEAPGGSAGIGVHGIEPGYVPGAMSKVTGEYSAAASRKPTYVPAWLQKREAATGFEALTTEQLASGAEKARGGRIKQAFESELGRRQTSKEALAFSEIARRAIIEGRDIPSAFKAYGVELSPAQGPREAFGRTTQGVRAISEAQEPKLRIASPEDWQKQQARRRGLI